jgi:ligand-binding SRPBCC domain-containing protein
MIATNKRSDSARFYKRGEDSGHSHNTMNFRKETFISATPERVFAFHELPDAFERLLPPWENAKVIQTADISKIGSRAIIEQKVFGLVPSRWVAEHTAYEPPSMFEDIQVSGPFSKWRHRHIVSPETGGAVLIDDIEYEPPFGFLGSFADPLFIRPKLEKMFEFRHSVTKEWCEGNDR